MDPGEQRTSVYSPVSHLWVRKRWWEDYEVIVPSGWEQRCRTYHTHQMEKPDVVSLMGVERRRHTRLNTISIEETGTLEVDAGNMPGKSEGDLTTNHLAD
jgi:hypothetical protein